MSRSALLLTTALCAFAPFAIAQKPTQEQLQAALNDPYNIAFNEGFRFQTLDKIRDAEAAFDRAVGLAQSNHDRLYALSFRGTMRGRLGLWKQARADLNDALRIDANDTIAQFALLEVARGQGDFRTAADTLLLLEKVLAAKPGEKTLRTNLAIERARTTAAWGDLQGALQQYEEAKPLLEAASDLALIARTQREMARLLLELNDKPAARALATEALGTDLRRVGTSRRRPTDDWITRGDRNVAQSILLIADCQIALGERVAARDNYHTAWKLAFKIVAPNELYRADLGRARVSLQLLQAGEKPLFFDSDVAGVVDLTKFEDFPAIRFEALGLLGEIQLAQKKTADAIASFQSAVALVEKTRETASSLEKQNFLALQASYYRWLIEAYAQKGDAWSALAASEALKARQLRETLSKNSAANQSFAETLQELRALSARLEADAAIISYANADWSRTDPIAFVIKNRGIQLVRLSLEKLPELVKRLPVAEVLASQKREVDARRYDLGNEIKLAGVVAYLRDCIYPDPQKPDLLRQRVEPMFATAALLNDLLFAPVEPLLQNTPRLLVSPNGLLAYLPFDLLLSSEKSAIAQRYTVTLTPSLLVTESLANRPDGSYTRPLLAFGGAIYNPANYDKAMADVPAMKQAFDQLVAVRQAVFNKSPFAGRYGPQNNLAGTKTEVLMINELVPGSQIELGRAASEGNVRSLAERGELKNSRVLHFAVHGMASPEMPALSGIILSYEGEDPNLPAERDGFLQITEIEKLPMRAELVTLSACQTGLGAIIAGEGVVGLTSSLFSAGADNVLASLWPVSDASSVYFMQRFYRLHLIENLPSDVAVALVKREFINGAAGASFRHPQHWAAFNLYGGRDLFLPK